MFLEDPLQGLLLLELFEKITMALQTEWLLLDFVSRMLDDLKSFCDDYSEEYLVDYILKRFQVDV